MTSRFERVCDFVTTVLEGGGGVKKLIWRHLWTSPLFDFVCHRVNPNFEWNIFTSYNWGFCIWFVAVKIVKRVDSTEKKYLSLCQTHIIRDCCCCSQLQNFKDFAKHVSHSSKICEFSRGENILTISPLRDVKKTFWKVVYKN